MGKFSLDKGANFELEVVNLANAHGLKAEGVPLSGATSYAKDDVVITPTFADRPWRGECKRRKDMPTWLVTALAGCDSVALLADRHAALAMISLHRLMELMHSVSGLIDPKTQIESRKGELRLGPAAPQVKDNP